MRPIQVIKERKKIAIDCRHVQYHREGITRFTLNIILSLQNNFAFSILLSDDKIKIPEFVGNKNINIYYLAPKWSKFDWIWENISLVLFLKKYRHEIYHAPCNTGIPLIKLKGVKYIVTIHDLLIMYFGKSYRFISRIKWHVGIRIALARADIVLADSNFTVSELSKYKFYNSKEKKCVYLGIDDTFMKYKRNKAVENALLSTFGVKSPYIVYHGGFRDYKNVKRVVSIYNNIRLLCAKCIKLVIIGSLNTEFKKNVEPFIIKSDYKEDVITPGYLSDEDLAVFLGGASLFIYTSKMEGFGFAPLEAMACGAPVLCNKNSSMIEILKNSCVWFNEEDLDNEIANKALERIFNENYKLDMLSVSARNAYQFNHSRFIEAMKSIYMK